MRDCQREMAIYQRLLQDIGDFIELVDKHCNKQSDPNLSDDVKYQITLFKGNSQKLIENFNDDLHFMYKLIFTLKEIEIEEEIDTEISEIANVEKDLKKGEV